MANVGAFSIAIQQPFGNPEPVFFADDNDNRPCLLVVEDDPHALAFMESSLDLAHYCVIGARSLSSALLGIEKRGIHRIEGVLTDYRLPDGTGIDLLETVREQDPSIAVVVITGQGDKAVVQAALTKGAFEYLDKPVTYKVLIEIAREAVGYTLRNRRAVQDRLELADLELMDQSLNERIPRALAEHIELIYRPLHQIGGDFFMTHDCGDGRYILLVGDVSGHDIRSGYASAYFQGLFRGYMESGASVEAAVSLFNRALRRDGWCSRQSDAPISVSIAIIDYDIHSEYLRHWNFGLAPCHIASARGSVRHADYGNFPLGWMDDVPPEPYLISRKDQAFLYLFTDGLQEYADDLGLNPFSLFYRLKDAANPVVDLPVAASDDILALRLSFNLKLSTLNSPQETILNEHYAGTEIDHIDHLQSVWRRSINFALDDILGDRLYDLLICIREGMINAFVHGCNRAPDKFAHLTISVDPGRTILRVQIDDPGRGHQFDLKKRLEELQLQTGEHLGLGIIQHLSDEFLVDNNGTTLVFDFKIQGDAI